MTFLDKDTISVERLDEDVVRRVTVKRLLKPFLVKVVTIVVKKREQTSRRVSERVFEKESRKVYSSPNESNGSTENEQTVEGTNLHVLGSFFRSESSRRFEQVAE